VPNQYDYTYFAGNEGAEILIDLATNAWLLTGEGERPDIFSRLFY
jgi:hypothetical protein